MNTNICIQERKREGDAHKNNEKENRIAQTSNVPHFAILRYTLSRQKKQLITGRCVFYSSSGDYSIRYQVLFIAGKNIKIKLHNTCQNLYVKLFKLEMLRHQAPHYHHLEALKLLSFTLLFPNIQILFQPIKSIPDHTTSGWYYYFYCINTY